MRDILKLGGILMLYALIAGSALAFVNGKTLPLITENKTIEETRARSEVLPGMDGGFELRNAEGPFPYWVGYRDAGKTETGGYIFVARGTGYSSVIESMVGVDTNGTIVAVRILSQQETPGLGAKIQEVRRSETAPWFPRQFAGKTVSDDIKVKKDGGDIDAITGATISSRTVTDSINRGLRELMKTIGGGS